MMSANRPAFRADVVGSLLRPQSIHDARAKRDAGGLTTEALRAIETTAIRDTVALQKAAGLKVCTDGEFHRRHWFLDFIERIDGVAIKGSLPQKFHNTGGKADWAPPRIEVHGKLGRTLPLAVHDFQDLAPIARAAGLLPKQAIPSPTLLHFRGGRPADLTIGMHICRGNHASAWVAEGAYDPVAEVLFGGIDVDALFVEYDSPRAGTFEPLRYLSKGKLAVLGLGHQQDPATGEQGRSQAPHRRRSKIRAAGPTGAVAAMRLYQHYPGQPPHGERPATQARAGGGDGRGGLEQLMAAILTGKGR